MEHDSSKSLQKKNMRNYRAIGECPIKRVIEKGH